jgi:SRSO17 transposase
MTRDEVRAAARRVTQWHGRFAGLFGREEPQKHSLDYLKGLTSNQKRKSVEPIALHFARGPNGAAATRKELVALQGFLKQSPCRVKSISTSSRFPLG